MTDLAVVEGDLITEEFSSLYRLLDLERTAEAEKQRLSMPAAFEILAAYRGDQWKQDKQAEFDLYVTEHKGIQPSWSPTSDRSFTTWLQDKVQAEGHPFQSERQLRSLRNAAAMSQIVTQVRARARTLPSTEGAWRPFTKLLTHGFNDQLVAAVQRAGEIAEAEGQTTITSGIASAARAEIWHTDPVIRKWVEQSGMDVRSRHDRVVSSLIKIRREANELRKSLRGNEDSWQEFLTGLAQIK